MRFFDNIKNNKNNFIIEKKTEKVLKKTCIGKNY